MTHRVALLADYTEEGWTSMDHYASMLAQQLAHADGLEASLVRTEFRERFGRLSAVLGPVHGRTLDRYANRYWDHPRDVARLRGFDLFHIVDQTYAASVRRLPAERTVVTCHDLDFVTPPPGTKRPWLVRATGGLALRGLRLAAHVMCDSDAIRQELARRGLVPPDRVSVVPLGVEPEFSRNGPTTLAAEAELLLAGRGAGPLLLHVGAVVQRKRLDLLLEVFGEIRRQIPEARLVRAGGRLPAELLATADRLGIRDAILEMPFLTRADLAALYRRADLFLLTSDTEGFALPVLEAMASGLPVVARELGAVRELGGDAVALVPAEDLTALKAVTVNLLGDPSARAGLRERGLTRAADFTWRTTAEKTRRVYERVLARSTSEPPALATRL